LSRHDVLELASAPGGEDCAQVGEENYGERARLECRALRSQILRAAAAAGVRVPETLELRTKGCPHDFGTYYELVARFPEDDEAAVEAAYWMEANLPYEWDAEARAELGLAPAEP
jgi:hypothetical protein